MLAADLIALDNHDTAAAALLVPALAAPAAVPAAIERLERTARLQRTLWQQRRRRQLARVAVEAGRQRVGDGLRGEVAAGLAIGRCCCWGGWSSVVLGGR